MTRSTDQGSSCTFLTHFPHLQILIICCWKIGISQPWCHSYSRDHPYSDAYCLLRQLVQIVVSWRVFFCDIFQIENLHILIKLSEPSPMVTKHTSLFWSVISSLKSFFKFFRIGKWQLAGGGGNQ